MVAGRAGRFQIAGADGAAMPQEPADTSGPGSDDPSEATSQTGHLETARANRDVTVGLPGTCIAVLTFALFFLFAWPYRPMG